MPEASELLEVPRDQALSAVRLMPGLLSQAPAEARDDRELALAAVAANALVFADLSERLRDDEDVVIAAATGWQWEDSPFPVRALKNASARLQRDPVFLDRLLQERPEEYDALDEDLQCDHTILERVFGAPNCASWLLAEAPDAVRRDPKWAGMAIDADPFALQHPLGDILDDYAVGMRAVQRDGRVLHMLSPRLRDDDAIARAAVVEGKGFPSGASDRLRDDEDYIVAALAKINGMKQRVDISMPTRPVFMCAGLYEISKDNKTDEPVPTFTILTVDPDEYLGSAHDRAPLVLEPDEYDAWLAGGELAKTLIHKHDDPSAFSIIPCADPPRLPATNVP